MSRIPSRLRDSKSHIWDSESHLRDSSAILFLEWDSESRLRDSKNKMADMNQNSVPYMGFWVPSTGFKKQDGGYESNLESHIWDSESRRHDGIRDNPVYGILSPTYGILGFTV